MRSFANSHRSDLSVGGTVVRADTAGGASELTSSFCNVRIGTTWMLLQSGHASHSHPFRHSLFTHSVIHPFPHSHSPITLLDCPRVSVWVGITALIVANALYVAAEFGAVGVRRNRFAA
jgi:hypothetical protein